jgi:predicted dehydrogenase
MTQSKNIGVALIGFGYWGPNLARNFSTQAGAQLRWICEMGEGRLARARQQYPGVRATADHREVLADPDVQLVLIATPVSTHFPLTRDCLNAGKDVLVAKPLALDHAQSEELVKLAEARGRMLAVDHTYLYTGAIAKMRELLDRGEIGDLIYLDSVRVNLGLFQHDVNVLYDLAPHDLSILCMLVPHRPIAIRAMGSTHGLSQVENQVYCHVEFENNATAHFHWNWLAPVKLRMMSVCGTKKMIVFDDNEASEKIKIYDKGISIRQGDKDALYKTIVDYRTGDMVAPQLDRSEALAAEAQDIIACVAQRKTPRSDGRFSLRVMKLLDSAQQSLKNGGERVVIA